MAKSLYSALFDWIVLRINHALLNKKDMEEAVSVSGPQPSHQAGHLQPQMTSVNNQGHQEPQARCRPSPGPAQWAGHTVQGSPSSPHPPHPGWGALGEPARGLGSISAPLMEKKSHDSKMATTGGPLGNNCIRSPSACPSGSWTSLGLKTSRGTVLSSSVSTMPTSSSSTTSTSTFSSWSR